MKYIDEMQGWNAETKCNEVKKMSLSEYDTGLISILELILIKLNRLPSPKGWGWHHYDEALHHEKDDV